MALLSTPCELWVSSVSRELGSCARLSMIHSASSTSFSPLPPPPPPHKCCAAAAFVAPASNFGGRRSWRLQEKLGAAVFRPNLPSMFESARNGTAMERPSHLVRAASSSDIDFENGNLAEGYLPKADFYKVEAILRPWRLSHVTSALIKMGIRGVTVTDVRGFGAQGGSRERQAGSEFCEEAFVVKAKLDIVVSHDQVESVIDTIIDEARTGEIGDGKIFVSPVSDVIRVRTGERGLKAERMAGGRADILSTYTGTNGI
ncbi:hypothetical protein BDL97_02G089100 [Sphagnum fallax]|nr:hypothetical protein BDL97_02G089100 [Sphagnum fallax]